MNVKNQTKAKLEYLPRSLWRWPNLFQNARAPSKLLYIVTLCVSMVCRGTYIYYGQTNDLLDLWYKS